MDPALIRDAAIFLGILIFYAVLARGLFNATEPRRRSALDVAERLCQSDQISDDRKQAICGLLDDVHSLRSAWTIILVIPRTLGKVFFCNPKEDELLAREDRDIPLHLRKDLAKFSEDWVLATLGNSLLASTLFVVFSLLFAAFFIYLASLSVVTTLLAETFQARNRHRQIRHRPAHGITT